MNKKEIIPILILIAMFVAAIYLTPKLPEQIPTHWGTSGQIDDYGSKYIGLYLFPVISLIIYVIFCLIPKIAVYKKNIAKFHVHFVDFKVIFVIFLALIYGVTLMPNFGITFNINYVLIPALSVLFFYVGGFLRHARRNFFVGIRTPWTLSSDYVWDKTHKIGGILLRIYSIYILVVLLLPKYFIWLFIIPLVAIVIFLLAYSYSLYNKKHLHSK